MNTNNTPLILVSPECMKFPMWLYVQMRIPHRKASAGVVGLPQWLIWLHNVCMHIGYPVCSNKWFIDILFSVYLKRRSLDDRSPTLLPPLCIDCDWKLCPCHLAYEKCIASAVKHCATVHKTMKNFIMLRIHEWSIEMLIDCTHTHTMSVWDTYTHQREAIHIQSETEFEPNSTSTTNPIVINSEFWSI